MIAHHRDKIELGAKQPVRYNEENSNRTAFFADTVVGAFVGILHPPPTEICRGVCTRYKINDLAGLRRRLDGL